MSKLDVLHSETARALRWQIPAREAAPVLAALVPAGGVLAMLVGIDGNFYRPHGAMMAFTPDGAMVGNLSSGCIEGDLRAHAAQVWQSGRPRRLLYGKNSPFFDIRLPCGSGIEVALMPLRNTTVLRQALAGIAAREEVVFACAGLPVVDLRPDLQVFVVGTGAEAQAFADLTRAGGFGVEQVSQIDPAQLDARSAVALFFHDHDREMGLLQVALQSPAFWIGAQGSRRAQARRLEALRALGVPAPSLSRIRGPIGLIPAARDPRVLAISVLADIVAAAE
ncbi:XdhC family protein [Phaeovulum sp. W22_SRMD_FR3]|uniref:XdhC family protein n=1 Tax=Phaeovulum sp. W22_SRMD_FR3 TaxID=3240274 RepID=UPI003F96CAD9